MLEVLNTLGFEARSLLGRVHVSGKSKLKSWLEQSPAVIKVLSGEGNFVTLKLKDKQSFNIALEQGLVMRAFTLYGEDDWLRISIGNEQELEQVKVWLDGLSLTSKTVEQE